MKRKRETELGGWVVKKEISLRKFGFLLSGSALGGEKGSHLGQAGTEQLICACYY